MAVFQDTIITNQGEALVAKLVGESAQLTFTRSVLSSTEYPSGTDYKALTALTGIEDDQPVGSVERLTAQGEPNTVEVRTTFINSNVTTAFTIWNYGVYANDPDLGEILFSVTPATIPDTMPPQGSGATFIAQCTYTITDQVSVEVVIYSAALVTFADLDKKVDKDPTAVVGNLSSWVNGGNLEDAGISAQDVATQTDLNNKVDKVPTAVGNNIATFVVGGNIQDGGRPLSDFGLAADVDNKIDKVPTAISDNVALWTTGGQLKDSLVPISQILNPDLTEYVRIDQIGVPSQYTEILTPAWIYDSGAINISAPIASVMGAHYVTDGTSSFFIYGINSGQGLTGFRKGGNGDFETDVTFDENIIFGDSMNFIAIFGNNGVYALCGGSGYANGPLLALIRNSYEYAELGSIDFTGTDGTTLADYGQCARFAVTSNAVTGGNWAAYHLGIMEVVAKSGSITSSTRFVRLRPTQSGVIIYQIDGPTGNEQLVWSSDYVHITRDNSIDPIIVSVPTYAYAVSNSIDFVHIFSVDAATEAITKLAYPADIAAFAAGRNQLHTTISDNSQYMMMVGLIYGNDPSDDTYEIAVFEATSPGNYVLRWSSSLITGEVANRNSMSISNSGNYFVLGQSPYGTETEFVKVFKWNNTTAVYEEFTVDAGLPAGSIYTSYITTDDTSMILSAIPNPNLRLFNLGEISDIDEIISYGIPFLDKNGIVYKQFLPESMGGTGGSGTSVNPSNATPEMDQENGAPGTATTYSRSDHIHPWGLPKVHLSTSFEYGQGGPTAAGHLMLTDQITNTYTQANGIAATPNAVYQVQQTALSASDAASAAQTLAGTANTNANTAITTANSKAPIAHAVAQTTYGLGTSAVYGHLKISPTYNAALADGANTALSQAGAVALYNAVSGGNNLLTSNNTWTGTNIYQQAVVSRTFSSAYSGNVAQVYLQGNWGGLIQRTYSATAPTQPQCSLVWGVISVYLGSGINGFAPSNATCNLGGTSASGTTHGNSAWQRIYSQSDISIISDRRTKKEIELIPDELVEAILDKITVRKFRLKNDESGELRFGAVAQEVEEVLQEIDPNENFSLFNKDAVYEDDDKTKEIVDYSYSLKYGELIPLLVQARKKDKQRIVELETKTTELEDQLKALTNKLMEAGVI